MYSESLRSDTKKVLNKIKDLDFLDKFYLAGGTALALQLGHRDSVDLDFFTLDKELPEGLEKELSSVSKYTVDKKSKSTLDGVLEGVKVSFFSHPYKQLFDFKGFEGVNIADERDIGAMKINAVVGRPTKKDFIDIYFLLEKYALKELIGFFEEKYSEADYNLLLILKSLAYFDDIEDPMPNMKKEVDWSDVVKVIKRESEKLVDLT